MKESKGNPSVDFVKMIMASGISRGRLGTTATEADGGLNIHSIFFCPQKLLIFC